ncbi:hypothetical protein [Microbacterium candidum]|uniref:Uncharacterized protein n=1 Tax=Microbacterium candidum TaxID=3041922 RepID=A0ABT7MUU5_9MICO|nr:hypothetical protein [Microbacterium sp. ASV49]MDL9978211.1 hypothetical protein [Microbacterium sp. ASV49]
MTSAGGPKRARATNDASYADLREPVYLLAPEARATTSTGVGWRPFGYLLLTVVWFVLAVIVLAVVFAVLPWRLSSDDVGPLGQSAGFSGGNLIGGVFALLLIAPLIGALFGVILTVSVGSFLSSATYLLRSLNPAFRQEKLSFSARSVRAEATGPASIAGLSTAFSLVPVRLTRWTKLVTIFTSQGLVVNVTLWVLGAWWGWFYVFTVCWMLWPAQGAASLVCAVVSVLLFAVFVYFVWRSRRAYPDIMPAAYRGTPYERSWPNRPREKPARKPAPKGAARAK